MYHKNASRKNLEFKIILNMLSLKQTWPRGRTNAACRCDETGGLRQETEWGKISFIEMTLPSKIEYRSIYIYIFLFLNRFSQINNWVKKRIAEQWRFPQNCINSLVAHISHADVTPFPSPPLSSPSPKNMETFQHFSLIWNIYCAIFDSFITDICCGGES